MASEIKPPIKVITFDLYNTLIETGHSQNFFWDIYRQHPNGFGTTFSDYKRLIIRHSLDELYHFLPQEFESAVKQNQDQLQAQIAQTRLYPETLEVLELLSNRWPLYLISNLASPYKKAYFELGLDQYFKAAIFSCDCGHAKPNKAIFKLVEQQAANCKQEEILMIGDSKIADMQGAKKAGWQALQINRHKIQLKKRQIANLKDLVTILDLIQ